MANPKPLIYAVDDEPDILQLIAVNLERSGFRVKTFPKASPLFKALETETPDLLVLDLMLPDIDGLDLCRNLKTDPKRKGIPILILSAKGDETDVVLGLELGADDYMIKPFSPKELAARVRAILRREKTAFEEPSGTLTVGEILEIDFQKFTASVRRRNVELTHAEFGILKILSKKPGWVFTRKKILDLLWGDEKWVIDRTIDVHIRHLRKKLGPAGDFIKSIRGEGYKLEP
jgi:DNA-binding response OmpR family regulator